MQEQDEENTEMHSQKGPPDQDNINITSFVVRRKLQPSYTEPSDSEANFPLEHLPLQPRTYNTLSRQGIHYVLELLQLHCQDVLSFRNFGHEELEDLQNALQASGFTPLLP